MNHRHDLFKERREHLQMTFGEVRRLTGLAKGTIIASEQPDSDPKSSTIRKLADCYGLDPQLSLNFKLTRRQFRLAVVNGAE